MRRWIFLLLAALLLTPGVQAVSAAPEEAFDLSADAAVLMEPETGTVLYEKDAHGHRSPASVTKIMTLLLIAEAVDAGTISMEDRVTASSAAASMGGSQIWLEEGESLTVDEMIKCIAVASANDCAVAMAEKLAGSERTFVQRMNERASQLGMKDTHFLNCTGLTEDEEHYTSAFDIALMSRELLKHAWITEYTTVWMDEVRGGQFGLTNTNKLVRFYDGCTGLKTGYTSTAMYCLSATAERNGESYIAVVMHAPSSDQRNQDARALLDYAFASYTLWRPEANVTLPPVPVKLGTAESIQPVLQSDSAVLLDRDGGEVKWEIDLPEELAAPVRAGDAIGTLTVKNDKGTAAEIAILAPENVEPLTIWDLWLRILTI